MFKNDPFFNKGPKNDPFADQEKRIKDWQAEDRRKQSERELNQKNARTTFILLLVLPVAICGLYCCCALIVFCVLVYKNQTAPRRPAAPPPPPPAAQTPLAAAGEAPQTPLPEGQQPPIPVPEGQPPPMPQPGTNPPPYPGNAPATTQNQQATPSTKVDVDDDEASQDDDEIK